MNVTQVNLNIKDLITYLAKQRPWSHLLCMAQDFQYTYMFQHQQWINMGTLSGIGELCSLGQQ